MDKIGDIINEFVFNSNYKLVTGERQQVWIFDIDNGIELAYLTILPEEENISYNIGTSDTAIKLEYKDNVYFIAVAQRYYFINDDLEIHYF